MTDDTTNNEPWLSEPAFESFWHAGFPCLIQRTVNLGTLCGYVDLPPGHPWLHLDCDAIPARVHGGVTYAELEGENYRIGFDCAHAGDHVPNKFNTHGTYRTIAYVRAQLRSLAEQARAPMTLGPDGKPLD